jgi:tRNA dimethylallyltransferase
LTGEMTRDEAIVAAQQGHRNYAKRQLTWFRREPEVKWLNHFGDSSEAIEQTTQFVSQSL